MLWTRNMQDLKRRDMRTRFQCGNLRKKSHGRTARSWKDDIKTNLKECFENADQIHVSHIRAHWQNNEHCGSMKEFLDKLNDHCFPTKKSGPCI